MLYDDGDAPDSLADDEEEDDDDSRGQNEDGKVRRPPLTRTGRGTTDRMLT